MMLIATPETMWSTPKITVATACSRPPSSPAAIAPSDALPWAVVVAEVAGTERAEDHHALEADVDDAGALGPQAAETGQPDRAWRRSGWRAMVPDEVEVVGAGDDLAAATAGGAPADAATTSQTRQRRRLRRAGGVAATPVAVTDAHAVDLLARRRGRAPARRATGLLLDRVRRSGGPPRRR